MAVARELHDARHAREVLRARVLRARAGEDGRRVALDVDDVRGRRVVGDERELLLHARAGGLEQRDRLAVRLREGRAGAVRRVRLRVGLEEGEVDDEDVGLAGGEPGDVEEVDVVLRERHDGLVVRRVEARLADVRPGEPARGRVRGGGDGGEVEEEQLPA